MHILNKIKEWIHSNQPQCTIYYCYYYYYYYYFAIAALGQHYLVIT